MSRLHSLQMSAAEVASHLGVADTSAVAIPPQVIEGDPGVIVIERDGRRHLVGAHWGFPRVAISIGEAEVIGLVADLTNPMWDRLVVDPSNRCVIPITHFGNPDGEPGAKTRTWFSVKDQPVMAWAGFWRDEPGVGPVYAGMTMTANAAIPPTNDRMPVLLEHGEIDLWLHGSIRDVIAFQFRDPPAVSRMGVVRTTDRWRGGAPPPTATQPALL